MSQTADCVASPARFRSDKPNGPRAGKHRLSRLTQALDLQDQAYKAATSTDTPVHVQAAFMRAWADIHEVSMAIRGQGKPKPVEARNAVRRGKQAPTAPIAPTSAPPTNGSQT